MGHTEAQPAQPVPMPGSQANKIQRFANDLKAGAPRRSGRRCPNARPQRSGRASTASRTLAMAKAAGLLNKTQSFESCMGCMATSGRRSERSWSACLRCAPPQPTPLSVKVSCTAAAHRELCTRSVRFAFWKIKSACVQQLCSKAVSLAVASCGKTCVRQQSTSPPVTHTSAQIVIAAVCSAVEVEAIFGSRMRRPITALQHVHSKLQTLFVIN